MRIIDISISLEEKKMILWPGNCDLKLKHISDMNQGKLYNETFLEMNMHTGTHIDAPLHFLAKGFSIEQFPLEIFIGQVFVAYLPKVKEITVKDLKKIKWPKGIKRVLFRTANSSLWGKGVSKFQKDYVGLTSESACWLVKRGIKLAGIDYLSIAKYDEVAPVHRVLLQNNIAIVESLNLNGVKSGVYQLVCLPVKIRGVEAAPARAVLIKS